VARQLEKATSIRELLQHFFRVDAMGLLSLKQRKRLAVLVNYQYLEMRMKKEKKMRMRLEREQNDARLNVLVEQALSRARRWLEPKSTKQRRVLLILHFLAEEESKTKGKAKAKK
jgi:hypothetical protein